MIKTIIEAIKQLESKFVNNELAYISLTGKNESFIRDNMACYLYSLKTNWCREFKRIDIAELSNTQSSNVKNIIELTSLYTTDILDEKHFRLHYLDKINNDFNKNSKYISKDTGVFIVIVATHFKNEVKKEYTNLVKYIDGINRGLSNYIEIRETKNILKEKEIIADCRNNIFMYFEPGKINIEYASINVGQAFEIDIELHFWILEKKICCCDKRFSWEVMDVLSLDKDDSYIGYCPYCGFYKSNKI